MSVVNEHFLARPDVLDQAIVWRMGDPKHARQYALKGDTMNRQWTIEGRADFEDPGKNEMITEAFRRAAAHIRATMELIKDKQSPQVVCFSEDFFLGHQEIALLKDDLGDALEKHDAASGEEAVISSEMLDAVREMAHDQNEAKLAQKK